jgi:hypothetical protein
MFKNPLYQYLGLISIVLLFLACQNQSSVNKDRSVSSEASLIVQDSIKYKPGAYYFGQKESSPLEPDKYNIDLVRFEVDTSKWVRGTFYFQPFGTDGMRGSFTGRMDPETDQLMCKRIYYIEGERYKEAFSFPLLKDSLGLGYTETGEVATVLPEIDSKTYQNHFATLTQQSLQARINTTDRSRLFKLELLKEQGFSQTDIETLQFMEVMTDLDNDYSQMEYLIYIMDPMLCGSGGCNLLVTKQDGSIISSITVSRPPIYIPLLSIEEQQAHKNQWKDLYVYSDGMRRLSYKAGSYTSNASLGVPVLETQLSAFPEHYVLIMDYLDQ